MGPQVERKRHDNRGAEGCEEGEWVFPSPHGVRSGEGCAPSPVFFSNFYIKIVSFRAFWIAISCRLADCLPESEIRLELKFTGDRSSILGTRPIITPSGKLRAKNDKKCTKNY